MTYLLKKMGYIFPSWFSMRSKSWLVQKSMMRMSFCSSQKTRSLKYVQVQSDKIERLCFRRQWSLLVKAWHYRSCFRVSISLKLHGNVCCGRRWPQESNSARRHVRIQRPWSYVCVCFQNTSCQITTKCAARMWTAARSRNWRSSFTRRCFQLFHKKTTRETLRPFLASSVCKSSSERMSAFS